MMRVKVVTVIRWCVQNEVKQEESEQDDVDAINKEINIESMGTTEFANMKIAKLRKWRDLIREVRYSSKTSRCTARWPLRYADLPDNYWLQIIRNTKHFCWWNIFDDMCMGRWLFWSNVNRSIFDKDIRQKTFFYIFVPIDLDLWLLDLRFAPLVALVHTHISTKLEVFKVFCFEKIRGTALMDWRTDRQTGCNA